MIKKLLKIMLIVIISIILIIALFFLSLKVFGSYILQKPNLRGLGSFIQLFFLPDDFGYNLVSKELDLTKAGLIYKYNFKNKYVGYYYCGILLKHFPSGMYHNKPDINFEIEVNFYVDEKLVSSFLYNNKIHYSPFWSGKDEYVSGIDFYHYTSPEELPLGKEIKCVIKIIKSDIEFHNKYGPVKFYISKMWDL